MGFKSSAVIRLRTVFRSIPSCSLLWTHGYHEDVYQDLDNFPAFDHCTVPPREQLKS
jgi:hypothetical protein